MCLLVQIELKKDNVTHAKVLIDSINNLIYKTKSDDYILRKKQYEAIYLYNLKINNDQKALSAYQNFNYFEKLFQNISNKDKISIIEIKAKSDVYNLEMVKIEEIKKTKDLLVTILLVLLSLFSLCVIYYFRKKVKLVEKTKSEISAINVIQAKEIDYLKKALLNQLDIIKNDNSNFLNKQEDIKALKEFNLSQKEQWESFKNLFLSTYPTFQSILDLKLGKTSSGELRLIMLHKLGLNNKEISQALFISIDGVKKANYRLYKKMNIKTSQELINFFD
jgi:ATP/maltotriose-dependent transcriptional regulator MalT